MKKSLPRPKIDFKTPSGLFYCDGAPISRASLLDGDCVAPEQESKYLCGTCGRRIDIDNQLLCPQCTRIHSPVSTLKVTRAEKDELLSTLGKRSNHASPLSPGKSALSFSRFSDQSSNQNSVSLADHAFGPEYMESLMQRATTHQERVLTATTRICYPSTLKVRTTHQLQDRTALISSDRPRSPYASSPPRQYGGRQDQLHHLPHHIDVKKLKISHKL